MRPGSVALVTILIVAATACSPSPPVSPSASATETPAALAGPSFVITCAAPANPTPSEPEGPFYRPDAPERPIFFGPEDREGETLVLGGAVLDTSCRPIAGAVVDVWHADPLGEYDETGSRFRGRGVTAADGTFRFDTLVPAGVDGEPPQIHVKVSGGGKRPLTTQLYLPPGTGENPALVLPIETTEQAQVGSFTFVLDEA